MNPTATAVAFGTATSRYQSLLRLSAALSDCRNCDSVENCFEEYLRAVVPFDYLNVLFFEDNDCSQPFRWCLFEGSQDGTADLDIPGEGTTATWVYEQQQTLVVADWQKDSSFPASREFLNSLKVRSTCSLPMTMGNRRFGIFEIGNAVPAAYSEEEVRFLELVVGHIALTVQAALSAEASEEAHAEVERKNDRLQLLLDLTSQIVANLDLREVLRTVAASLRRVMHCDAVGVNLFESEANQLRSYVLDFPESKGAMQEGILIPLDNTLPGTVYRTGKPLISQADLGKEFPCSTIASEGLKSGCLVPLISGNGILGVLGLAKFDEAPFSQDDVDFLSQVAKQLAIAVDNALAYSQIAQLKDKLAQEKLYLEDEIRNDMNFEDIVGQSPALLRVLQLVETVAPSDSTVLLLGETGTGKELIARAIHDRSNRKDRTFVKLNCAAIPTGLLESELFGHEKGAFTGAISQKTGRLQLADQGTLFLDEVGDIPLEIQPKLLRALQEREFERLGSSRTQKVDARLVAATNRDLDQMMADRQFRSDLYYRLNVFPILIPPLRERPEDIPLLVRYFAQKYARRMQKQIETIPLQAINKLASWSWPGNIRELENFIERAVILTRGTVLQLPVSELRTAGPEPTGSHEVQRGEIVQILRQTKGRVGGADGAAARLGVKRTTLISRMKKFGISPQELS